MHNSATQSLAQLPTEQAGSRRNAIGCALLVGLCVLITRPILEMGIVDDPSYVHTALEFARTGHLVYNGGATATLGWQVLWGALFIKLFGFSFTVVRLSTLPIAMGSIYLLHQIMARFGLNQRNAVLGTLSVALSPVFLALTSTFMTDVAAFFCLLLCLYLCQRAVFATTAQAAILWLCLAAFLSVVGGTARQTAWLGALVMVPSAAWLLRGRRRVLAASAFAWLISVVAIYLCIRWFYRQPYFLLEKMPFGRIGDSQLRIFALRWTGVLLSIVLLCLPVFMAFVPAVRRLPHRIVLTGSTLLVLCLAAFALLSLHFPSLRSMLLPPWLVNNVNAGGIMNNYDILGYRPGILAIPVRAALAAMVVASGCSVLAIVFAKPAALTNEQPKENSLSWHRLLWLVVPFTLAYLALLLPRGLFGTAMSNVFDRYLLPVLASVTIVLVRFYQDRVKATLPIITPVLLAVIGVWAVAGIHDLFAMDRARVAAADEVRLTGVPRTQIQVGFEYDFWTQVETAGYTPDERIHIPKEASRPLPLRTGHEPPYRFWYTDWTPNVHPKYFLVFTPQSYFKPTEFTPVSYRTWLPPFGATVYVQQAP